MQKKKIQKKLQYFEKIFKICQKKFAYFFYPHGVKRQKHVLSPTSQPYINNKPVNATR